MTPMSLFRSNIEQMPPYVPGEQPAAGAKVIKLNTNENPYPPSPAAIKVLHELDAERLRLYSDPMAKAFCQAAGRALHVPPEWVIAGNGSDDLLAMVFLACVEEGRRAVCPVPTYVLYRTLAQMQRGTFVEIPMDEEYNLPVAMIIEAAGDVTLLARPNSPSGTAWPLEQIAEIAAGVSGLVVLDEAYVDFAEDTGLELVRKFPNVLVLRTLSKGYSLAGLRLGFGVGNPRLVEMLGKVKDSYAVDAVACLVGAAAMDDQAYMLANARKVKASRASLSAELTRLGFRVVPSQSNFLLAAVPGGRARELYLGLKDRAILVRYFSEPQLTDKLRISVGTDEQNRELVRAIGEVIGTEGHRR
jgi:histidinol-phosphate aminotransferase